MEILKNVLTTLFSKEKGNALLELVVGQLDKVIVAVEKSLVDGELGDKILKSTCRTILDFEKELRAAIVASPSEWDDKVLDELIEAAKAVVPDYVPIS